MLNAHMPAVKQQTLIGACVFVIGMLLAWQAGGQIASGDMKIVVYAGLALAGGAAALVILRSWRTGFCLFLVWLLFEDLARKYMGNALALFFGKDILAALTYISHYAAIRKGREKTFRPLFLLPLAAKDASALASMVRRLYEDAPFRAELASNAAETAQKYSWEGNARELTALFEELLRKKAWITPQTTAEES